MAVDKNIMGWDDVIENDGQEFVILPEGDYTFTVSGFERGSFPGGAKIPACPKATITLNIDNDQGVATARVDLLLYRTVEWKMAAFFRCIGQKKHGEKVVMNWNKVAGSRGKAHFKPRSYTNRNGETRQVNDVDYFIDYDPSVAYTPVNQEDLPWGSEGF
jgi:hypothetical protein